MSPQDEKEAIAISFHGIHCISKYYKEENCYSAGFVVSGLSGYSRKGEGRQEKQLSGHGDRHNLLLLWAK